MNPIIADNIKPNNNHNQLAFIRFVSFRKTNVMSNNNPAPAVDINIVLAVDGLIPHPFFFNKKYPATPAASNIKIVFMLVLGT